MIFLIYGKLTKVDLFIPYKLFTSKYIKYNIVSLDKVEYIYYLCEHIAAVTIDYKTIVYCVL
jgi:hypothetical protein